MLSKETMSNNPVRLSKIYENFDGSSKSVSILTFLENFTIHLVDTSFTELTYSSIRNLIAILRISLLISV